MKLSSISIIVLALFAFSILVFPAQSFAGETREGEVSKLLHDVYVLNLLNLLELSEDQMRFIISKTKEAKALRDRVGIALEADSRKTKAELLELKKRLTDYKTFSKEDKRQYLTDLIQQKHNEKKKLRGDIDKIIVDVSDSLTGKQLYIIRVYRNSVVPPRLALTGEFDVLKVVITRLDKMRDFPEEEYNDRKIEFMADIIKRAKKSRPLGRLKDQAKIEGELSSLLDEARGLLTSEYAARKDLIARRIKEIMHLGERDETLDIRIEKFLLDERVIPYLEEKLKAR